MQRTIIADTSYLILLDKIGFIDLLKTLFGELFVTSVIAEEFGSTLPPWIKVADAQNKQYQNILQASVDKGEASAIALAVEQSDCLLILDDQKARKLASELKLKHTGTLALIVDAKLAGHIDSVKSILDKIRSTNFRVSQELESIILKKSGE